MRRSSTVVFLAAISLFSGRPSEGAAEPDRYAFRGIDTRIDSVEFTRPPRDRVGAGRPAPAPTPFTLDTKADVTHSGVASDPSPAKPGLSLRAGDRIVTGRDAAVRIRLAGSSILTLSEDAELRVDEPGEGKPPRLALLRGAVALSAPRPNPVRKGEAPRSTYRIEFEIRGAFTGVRSGQFFAEVERANPDTGLVSLFDGELDAALDRATLDATQGFPVPKEHFIHIQGDSKGPVRIDSPRPFHRSDYLRGVTKRLPLLARLRGRAVRNLPSESKRN